IAAIAALGRMGAVSSESRIVLALEAGAPAEMEAALDALAEMRSAAGKAAACALLAREPPEPLGLAAVRYLAEIGEPAGRGTLRALARDARPAVRLAAAFARRALEASSRRDAASGFLAALTEPDRAVRAILARRLRTLPVADVIAQAELLLSE